MYGDLLLESSFALPAGELGVCFDRLAQVPLPILLLHDPIVALESGRPPSREKQFSDEMQWYDMKWAALTCCGGVPAASEELGH